MSTETEHDDIEEEPIKEALTPEQIAELKASLGPPLAPWDAAKITEVARGLVTNALYLSWMGDREFDNAFGFIVRIMEMKHIPVNAIGMYAELAKAGPMSINGVPFFFSGSFIPKESASPLIARYKELRQALGLDVDEFDEDGDECPNCGRVLGTSDGKPSCNNCGPVSQMVVE